MADDRPPSIDALARSLAGTGLPHPVLVDLARAAVADDAVDAAPARADDRRRALLGRVINATGVLLHTNLGRAPIGAVDHGGPSNLELDVATGERGDRQRSIGELVALACGAEAALVVNNGAAAVLLVLAAVATGRDVAVSRGELIEIGGGFRIPDVLAQSGARLVEVGTTNRTRQSDYATAVDDPRSDVAALLKVHRSNHRVTGFTEEASVVELADLGPPVVVDLGAGLLDEACPWLSDGPPAWLRGEPGVRQVLSAGASVVTVSGDKLLGGPQAGLVIGSRAIVQRCARHPLLRALRPGGLVLAALQDVVLAHLRRDGDAIGFWRQAARPVAELRARAEAIVAAAGVGAVVDAEATTGGGTLPDVVVPSVAVAVDGDHRVSLRAAERPIVARVRDGRTLLDLRTVEPGDDERLVAALRGIGAP